MVVDVGGKVGSIGMPKSRECIGMRVTEIGLLIWQVIAVF